MGAVLACGRGAVLSHRAAGDHSGIHRSDAPISITVARHCYGPPEINVHRSGSLEPADVTVIEGIPLTSVPRTLLDLAAVVTKQELARAVDRSERLEVFDLTAVENLLQRANGHQGVGALRKAIAAWQPRHTRKELEDRFQDLLEATNLPLPSQNVLLQGERNLHEVDAYWPGHHLVVELDSYAYHRTRRDLQHDADTNADLELAGYRVVRLTWDDVTSHRSRTIARLRKLLASDT
jgi:very-short-patch-repair endonuclease